MQASRKRPFLKSNTNKKNKVVEEKGVFFILAIDRKDVLGDTENKYKGKYH